MKNGDFYVAILIVYVCGTNTFDYYQVRIRLGRWVTSIWGYGYGPDNTGQVTGAQLIGFGLLDNQWGSFTYNAK